MTKTHFVRVTRTLEFYYMETNLSREEAVKEAISDTKYSCYDLYPSANCEYDSDWKEVSNE